MSTSPYLIIASILIALSFCLLGTSMILMGGHTHISLTTDFYGVTDMLSKGNFNLIAALAFIVSGLLLVANALKKVDNRHAGSVLILMGLIPSVTLLGGSMWIDSLGGFPAIGSGQGVIKYFALISVGILLTNPSSFSQREKQWIAIFPVLLVLLWIGGMKFTLLEAQGIEPLVKSSILMSWMYELWDLQTTSNLIGIYDLLAAGLLMAAIYKRTLLFSAIAMAGAVFVVTQTFIFSWDAALSGKTLLTTGGHFLIKDLWFIANLLLFWELSKASEWGLFSHRF